jgi:hypothetical protein
MSVFVSRTSQKLNFAQLQLEQLAQAQASTGWSRLALVESYQESVLFHLMSAYVAFLREIGDHYRLNTTAVQCFADLDALFEQAAVVSPERSELAALEQDASGWLRQLSMAYDACWQPRARRDEAAVQPSQSEISLVQIASKADGVEVTPQQCCEWHAELGRLVERLRAGMQEW